MRMRSVIIDKSFPVQIRGCLGNLFICYTVHPFVLDLSTTRLLCSGCCARFSRCWMILVCEFSKPLRLTSPELNILSVAMATVLRRMIASSGKAATFLQILPIERN